MEKILIIQLAFLGDVLLATSLLESINYIYSNVQYHVLVKKQYSSVFENHPYVSKILKFDTLESKAKELIRLQNLIKAEKYDCVINIHRFFSSGYLTAMSKAPIRSGFSKNPFSLLFTHRAKHEFASGIHEIDRNIRLISFLNVYKPSMPKLYPIDEHQNSIKHLKNYPYITIAPASVWYTKQYPIEKWVEFINELSTEFNVYLIGSDVDYSVCEMIKNNINHPKVKNLCGQLTILQTASLMGDAVMNFSNDSAPTHIASSMNAPIVTIYCSTVPEFGFGPISTNAHVVETEEHLACRPCGLHGRKSCPEKHFLCAYTINKERLLKVFN